MTTHSCDDLECASLPATQKQRLGFTLFELLAVVLILVVLYLLLIPGMRSAREPARRSACKNNLKQIGLALHNYASLHGAFPPAYTVDADGKPLHSWRTLILPFLEEQELYDKIDLSKPWDDPANSEAFGTIPPVYVCPSFYPPEQHTTYLAIVSPNSFIRPTESRDYSEVKDHETIVMVIETDPQHAVHWMAPQDTDEQYVLDFGPETRFAHTGLTNALMVDGSVQSLTSEFPTDKRRELISVQKAGQ